MTIARLTHFGGIVCMVAALLMAASDLVSVTLNASKPAVITTSAPGTAFTVLRLVGTVLLLLGLVGLYLHQSVAAGRLRLAGFLVAFAGTALIAAAWWFQVCALRWLPGIAPTPSISGTLAPGESVTFILFALGWLLLGLATLCSRVCPRLAGSASQSGPTDIPTRRQLVVELNTLRPTGSKPRRAR